MSTRLRAKASRHDLLPVVLAADLGEVDVERQWLVEPLWARAGVGFLGGSPKSNKSWIGLDLALSVASDTRCLGRFDVRDPGPVLLYLAEDAPAMVKQRLAGLCMPRKLDLAPLPIHVVTAPSLRLDLPKDQERLHRTVAAIRPRLIVLDPFVRLVRIDENRAAEVSAVLGFLRELQREHDVAILVVHHAKKNGFNGGDGQGLRGSGDFHAWIDSGIYVRRRRGEIVVTVEHRAAAAPEPFGIGLVTTDDPLAPAYLVAHDASVGGDSDADAATPNLHAHIVTQLGMHSPQSRESLRAALRVKNDRIGVALSELEASRRIERTPRGWRLASLTHTSSP